jgi:hypothetical protein
MMKPLLTTLALMALAGSCQYGVSDIPSIPDNPTYTRDIFPLYADHCLVCHASPPNRGAPSTFRLDAYGTAGGVMGAGFWDTPNADHTEFSIPKKCRDQVNDNKMPPSAAHGEGVGPNGLRMLKNWVENGAPE